MSKIKHIISVIHLYNMRGCVFSVYPFSCNHHQIGSLNYYPCLGLGHETMVCAVCLSIFINSLRASDAHMRQQINKHWIRQLHWNKIHRNFNRNSNISIQENAFVIGIHEKADILIWPQYINVFVSLTTLLFFVSSCSMYILYEQKC